MYVLHRNIIIAIYIVSKIKMQYILGYVSSAKSNIGICIVDEKSANAQS